MKYPTDSISRNYYFTSSDVIYEISQNQDADECGKLPGFDSSGNILSEDELATIFPYLKLNYTVEGTTLTGVKYLWLQNFIVDGDKFNGSKFTAVKHPNDSDGATTFVDRFIKQAKTEIDTKLRNGASITWLKNVYPPYLVSDKDFYMTINGKNCLVTSVSRSDGTENLVVLSDTHIKEVLEETAKEKALVAANNVVKPIDIIYKKVTLST